jgi:hypothetical protein
MEFFDVIVRESQPLAISALDTVVCLLSPRSISSLTFPGFWSGEDPHDLLSSRGTLCGLESGGEILLR